LQGILGNSRSLSCLSALYSEVACKDNLVGTKDYYYLFYFISSWDKRLLAIEDHFQTRIYLYIKDSSNKRKEIKNKERKKNEFKVTMQPCNMGRP
jgi:hypothetical protein